MTAILNRVKTQWNINDLEAMTVFGRQLAAAIGNSAMIELIGDVGAGKTTLVKAIAAGLGIDDDVQSPSFTISRTYEVADGRRLVHYDFYRLNDAGIMKADIAESSAATSTITIVEWANVAADVLPLDRLTVTITPTAETARHLKLSAGGKKSQEIMELLV